MSSERNDSAASMTATLRVPISQQAADEMSASGDRIGGREVAALLADAEPAIELLALDISVAADRRATLSLTAVAILADGSCGDAIADATASSVSGLVGPFVHAVGRLCDGPDDPSDSATEPIAALDVTVESLAR